MKLPSLPLIFRSCLSTWTALVLGLLLLSQACQAELLNVRFSGGGGSVMVGPGAVGAPGDQWNNISYGGLGVLLPITGSSTGLHFSDGTGSVTMRYSISTGQQSVVQYASNASSGISPNATLYGGWLALTNGFHGTNNSTKINYTLTGLSPNTAYTLHIYSGLAALTGTSGPGAQVAFTAGTSTQVSTYAASGEYTPGVNYLAFPGLVSDASGTLSFSWNFVLGTGGTTSDLFQGFQVEASGAGTGAYPPNITALQMGIVTSPVQNGSLVVQASPYNVITPASIATAASKVFYDTMAGSISLQMQCNSAGSAPVGNGFNPRDRGVAVGDQGRYKALFESFIGTARTDLRIQVQGLVPNTTYQIQTWAWDRTYGNTGDIHFRVYDTLAADSAKNPGTWMGTIPSAQTGGTGGNTPTSLSTGTLIFQATSDSKGNLIFGPSKIDAFGNTSLGSPMLNGFILSRVDQVKLTSVLGGSNGSGLTDLFDTENNNADNSFGIHGIRYGINWPDYWNTASQSVPTAGLARIDTDILRFYQMGHAPRIEFEYYSNHAKYASSGNLTDYNFITIGNTFATRYMPNSAWLQSQGIYNWGVTEYDAFNEPDNLGDANSFGNPLPADFVNAMMQLTQGVHTASSNDPKAMALRVRVGGFADPIAGNGNAYGNANNCDGYLPALISAGLFTPGGFAYGMLDGIDIHNYNISTGAQITTLNYTPQTVFDRVKSTSGLTQDVHYFDSEWNAFNTTLGTTDDLYSANFLTDLWAHLTLLGPIKSNSVDNLRTQMAFAYSLSVFAPHATKPWYFGILSSYDPPIPTYRGQVETDAANLLDGMQFTGVQVGPNNQAYSAQLQSDNGCKLYVLINVPDFIGTQVTSYNLTNLPPNTAAVDVWYWDGIVSTIPITAGTTSTPVTLRTPPSQGETVMFLARPELISVVSRKTHGTAGTFDLPIKLQGQGPMTVEPRSNAGGLTLIYTFGDSLQTSGIVTANDGTNTVTGSLSISGNTATVTFANVSDQTRLRVNLSRLLTTTGRAVPSANIALGLLYGDVSQDGYVNLNPVTSATTTFDTNLVTSEKNPSGIALEQSRMCFDIDLSGVVDAADVTAVTTNAGHHLP